MCVVVSVLVDLLLFVSDIFILVSVNSAQIFVIAKFGLQKFHSSTIYLSHDFFYNTNIVSNKTEVLYIKTAKVTILVKNRHRYSRRSVPRNRPLSI